MSSPAPYEKSIFEELTPDDFELVIQDLELQKKGVNIHYVVDAFDVVEYCFPFGVNAPRNKSLERVGDEQLAYYFLFFQNRPVLLDEYKSELYTNTRRGLTTDDNGLNADDNYYLLDKFIVDYDKASETERKILLAKLERNLSFLISAIVYSSSAADFYESLFTQRLLSGESSPDDAVDGEMIYNTFINTGPTETSRNWLKQWHDSKKIDFKSKSYAEVFEQLKRVYRDLVAIERVLAVNNALIPHNGNKHLFLYFSTTARSTDFFENLGMHSMVDQNFRLLKKAVDGADIHHKSILRKQKHAYLLFLSQVPESAHQSKSKQLDQWIDNVKKIKDVREKYEEATFKKWRELNLDYAMQLEKGLKANQVFKTPIHQIYKSRRDQALKYLQDLQFQELREFIDIELSNLVKIDPKYLEESSEYKAFALERRFSDILHLLHKKRKVIVEPGRDYIVSSYHHLPVLLYYRQGLPGQITTTSDAIRLTYKIANYISFSEEKREAECEGLMEEIKHYLKTAKKHADRDVRTQLLNLLLLQVTPFDEKRQAEIRNNSVTDANVHYEFFKMSRLVHYYDDTEEQWKSYEDKSQENGAVQEEIEILYLKAWFERRDRQYSESISTCQTALKIAKPYDPRFIHGICLAKFCKYIDTRDNSMHDIEILEDCINECRNALEIYSKNILEPFQSPIMQLLEGNFAAVHNLKRYLEACLFILKKKYAISFDEEARFASIRKSTRHIEDFFEKYDISSLSRGDMMRPERLCMACEELTLCSRDAGRIETSIGMIKVFKTDFKNTFKKSSSTNPHKVAILDLFDSAIQSLQRLRDGGLDAY